MGRFLSLDRTANISGESFRFLRKFLSEILYDGRWDASGARVCRVASAGERGMLQLLQQCLRLSVSIWTTPSSKDAKISRIPRLPQRLGPENIAWTVMVAAPTALESRLTPSSQLGGMDEARESASQSVPEHS